MGAKNGRSVYDTITRGYRRSVIDFDGNGAIGVSIPAEWAREHNVSAGDEVALMPSEDEDGILEVHVK